MKISWIIFASLFFAIEVIFLLSVSGCVQTQADRAAIANLAIAHDPTLAPDFCNREMWGCK